MDPYSFSALCFAFCSFFVGLLVWLKRMDEVGKLFFWHSICISIWGIGFAAVISPETSYDSALWAIRPANGVAAFIPIAWYHFTLALTGGLRHRQRILKLLYSVAALIFCFSLTPWFIPNLRPILNFNHYTNAGPLYSALTLLYFLTVPLGFHELIQKIRKTSSEERKQFIGLLVISFLGYLGGSLTFIPVYDIPLPQYGIFLLPIYPFGLAYVITRTSIFNVEELAQAAHRDKLTAIGVLAASINHEVKNPLFIIKGLAEGWVERQKEGIFPNKEKALDSAADTMRRSIDQADRAMDIIRNLSSFAKAGIESEIKLESVRIRDVLEDILPLVRYELASLEVVLTMNIPKDIPEVCADRRYLEEILFNLLINAIQALKERSRGREIKISATPSRPGLEKHLKTGSLEGDVVTITIQDNGPGIPAEKIKDVFRPFYTTKAEGTGLGLYITQRLVEKIHGGINVNPASKDATVFMLFLPAMKQRPL